MRKQFLAATLIWALLLPAVVSAQTEVMTTDSSAITNDYSEELYNQQQAAEQAYRDSLPKISNNVNRTISAKGPKGQVASWDTNLYIPEVVNGRIAVQEALVPGSVVNKQLEPILRILKKIDKKIPKGLSPEEAEAFAENDESIKKDLTELISLALTAAFSGLVDKFAVNLKQSVRVIDLKTGKDVITQPIMNEFGSPKAWSLGSNGLAWVQFNKTSKNKKLAKQIKIHWYDFAKKKDVVVKTIDDASDNFKSIKANYNSLVLELKSSESQSSLTAFDIPTRAVTFKGDRAEYQAQEKNLILVASGSHYTVAAISLLDGSAHQMHIIDHLDKNKEKAIEVNAPVSEIHIYGEYVLFYSDRWMLYHIGTDELKPLDSIAVGDSVVSFEGDTIVTVGSWTNKTANIYTLYSIASGEACTLLNDNADSLQALGYTKGSFVYLSVAEPANPLSGEGVEKTKEDPLGLKHVIKLYEKNRYQSNKAYDIASKILIYQAE